MENGISSYLMINGVIVILLIFSFLTLRRSRKGPTRLNLKNKGPSTSVITTDAQKLVKAAEQAEAKHAKFEFVNEPPKSRPVKELNVIFNYNGHSWDAYEAIGIPAGSSIEKVQEAYNKMIAKMDAESRGFVDEAYKAIIKRM